MLVHLQLQFYLSLDEKHSYFLSKTFTREWPFFSTHLEQVTCLCIQALETTYHVWAFLWVPRYHPTLIHLPYLSILQYHPCLENKTRSEVGIEEITLWLSIIQLKVSCAQLHVVHTKKFADERLCFKGFEVVYVLTSSNKNNRRLCSSNSAVKYVYYETTSQLEIINTTQTQHQHNLLSIFHTPSY